MYYRTFTRLRRRLPVACVTTVCASAVRVLAGCEGAVEPPLPPPPAMTAPVRLLAPKPPPPRPTVAARVRAPLPDAGPSPAAENAAAAEKPEKPEKPEQSEKQEPQVDEIVGPTVPATATEHDPLTWNLVRAPDSIVWRWPTREAAETLDVRDQNGVSWPHEAIWCESAPGYEVELRLLDPFPVGRRLLVVGTMATAGGPPETFGVSVGVR